MKKTRDIYALSFLSIAAAAVEKKQWFYVPAAPFSILPFREGDVKMQQYINSIGFHLLMIGGVIASVAYLVVLFVGWLLIVQP